MGKIGSDRVNNFDQVVVGVLPDGYVVYASQNLIAQKGMAKVRHELVDRRWFAVGLTPPGYHPVRTSLNDNPLNTVWVQASDPVDAVNKYLREFK